MLDVSARLPLPFQQKLASARVLVKLRVKRPVALSVTLDTLPLFNIVVVVTWFTEAQALLKK